MRISDLSADDADSLSTCRECRFTGTGHVLLCGWHENVVAATAALHRMTAKERKQ